MHYNRGVWLKRPVHLTLIRKQGKRRGPEEPISPPRACPQRPASDCIPPHKASITTWSHRLETSSLAHRSLGDSRFKIEQLQTLSMPWVGLAWKVLEFPINLPASTPALFQSWLNRTYLILLNMTALSSLNSYFCFTQKKPTFLQGEVTSSTQSPPPFSRMYTHACAHAHTHAHPLILLQAQQPPQGFPNTLGTCLSPLDGRIPPTALDSQFSPFVPQLSLQQHGLEERYRLPWTSLTYDDSA